MDYIYNGSAIDVLKKFPSEIFDCIVTSPPYYGLRDYGVTNQIGQENTVDQYLDNLVKVFSECKRTLKKTGVMYINIADTYGGTGSKGKYKDPKYPDGRNGQTVSITQKLKPKSLLQIPERLSIKIQDELDLIKRNTIIWHKNALPLDAKDRFSPNFEYIYFFVKAKKYDFKTQYQLKKQSSIKREKGAVSNKTKGHDLETDYISAIKRNRPRKKDPNRVSNPFIIKRCIWEIPLQGFKGAHFATFPERLITPLIDSGCPFDNGLVLDPFMGSGTTGLVAKKLGKYFVGIELNPEYVKMANNRIKSILSF